VTPPNKHGGRERGGGKGGGGPPRGGRWQGTGEAAGGGGGKRNRRKEQRTELTKRNSLTEDTPRDAVTNALRLHLHNFAYKTFKIKLNDPKAGGGGGTLVGLGFSWLGTPGSLSILVGLVRSV
jgi:hypothetical protein